MNRPPWIAAGAVAALLLGGALWLALPVAAADPLAALPQPAGAPPTCEASAALVVPCGDDRCVLVLDNEQRDHVYLLGLSDEGTPTASSSVPLPGVVSDLEAVAGLPTGELLLFGSHSRNTRCKPRDNRRRIVRGSLVDGRIEGVVSKSGGARTCADLIGGQTGGVLGSACGRIDQAETQGTMVHAEYPDPEGTLEIAARDACAAAGTLNVEGALWHDGRVWIGLRAPLDGHGRAYLLRLAAPDALAADAGLVLDLGGLGVRALATDGDTVWGIAGGPSDADIGWRLFRFPTAELVPDGTVTPRFVGDPLPPSSEGLALLGDRALVVIDGAEGPSEDRCTVPSRYVVVSLAESDGGLRGPGSEGKPR